MTEYQSHTNEVRLEQLPGIKEYDLSGRKGHGLMNQKLDDINFKMEEDKNLDEEGNEDDCKPAAIEKSQDDDDVSDSEEEPRKKKRRKESFSLGCEVLQQHIKFHKEGHPVYFERQKLLEKAQEAQKRLVEVDAIRREYQQTVDAYQDLHQRYQDEHGIHRLFETMPMRFSELQVDDKRKSQLMYSIGQMLKESSTPFPLSNATYLPVQEVLMNKWKLRCHFKYGLILKMQDAEESSREQKKFCWRRRLFHSSIWQ